jgi:PKD repeat protein
LIFFSKFAFQNNFMFRTSISFIFFIFSVFISNAQEVTHKGSATQFSDLQGSIIPSTIKDDWQVSLRHFSTYFHNSDLPLSEYKKLKDEANQRRLNPIQKNPNPNTARSNVAKSPVLGSNFRGNLRGGGIPMDNTMAVSRNGFVVSAINSNVIFTLPDGTNTFTRGFADFYKILGLGSRMFDPRVIYDPETNKFIMVVLHGSDPLSSHLCIAFSKTEDPNGEWNFYKIKGDLEKDGVWFDFPNIAVSKDDLFIGGNMFTAENGYAYSMIVQISKEEGYQGQQLPFKHYAGIPGTQGSNVFNPVPAMSGWETLTSEMYFVSNAFNGFHINVIEESLENNPVIKSYRYTGPTVGYPPEARQKNTKVLLNTGGNRLRCAIYQNGVIHFAAQTNTDAGDVGIYYGRAEVASQTVTADVITDPGKDLAYPTITSFGTTEDSDVFLLNYTYAGPDEFPGQAARTLRGVGEEFLWSDEVIIKLGNTPIGASQDESIRWGDYSGACRRFIDGRVESWICGTYGTNNSHNTWIGQLISADDMIKPLAEFKAWPTSTQVDSLITFTNLTNIIPDSVAWVFPGGSPELSYESTPKVTYSANGKYDVKMIYYYGDQKDSITKKEYISIYTPEIAPVADWIADKDTIYIDDSVLFTSLSSENSQNHKWTFINGTPSSSIEKSQEVQYKKKGTFLVSLTVNNIAGSNTLTRTKAITVLEKLPPSPSFNAVKTNILEGESVTFKNLSKNAVKYQWTFEGGEPATSSAAEPVVTFPLMGTYDVKLVVENDFGVDSLELKDYITVGVSSTENIEKSSPWMVYPNPVKTNEMVTIQLDSDNNQKYTIQLVNTNGQIIKVLYDDLIKKGTNILSFNAGMLQTGIYFIYIKDTLNNLKTAKLQVVE